MLYRPLTLLLVLTACGSDAPDDEPDAGALAYDDPLVVLSDLEAGEVLGVEDLALVGTTLLVCSSSGLIGYDIADPANPSETFRADVAGVGACQHVVTAGDVAFVSNHGTQSSPEAILAAYQVSGTAATLLDSVSDGVLFEGLAVSGSFVVAARGAAGVASFAWDGSSLTAAGNLTNGLVNAWNVEPVDGGLLVADAADGIVTLSIDAAGDLAELGRLELAGSPQELITSDAAAFVGAGIGGIHAIDISDLAAPTLLGTTKTRTSANQMAVRGSFLYVADWLDARVYYIGNPGNMPVVATERIRRESVSGVRGIAATPEAIIVGDWQAPVLLQHEEQTSPDIWTASLSVDFGSVQAGDNDAVSLLVRNEGNAPLVIDRIEVEGGGFSAIQSTLTISPNQPNVVELRFSPSSGDEASGRVILHSADPDQPSYEVSLRGNGPGLAVGDELPEVVLAVLGGGEFRSSQQLGNLYMLAYFATY